jgi:hypothetical protein
MRLEREANQHGGLVGIGIVYPGVAEFGSDLHVAEAELDAGFGYRLEPLHEAEPQVKEEAMSLDSQLTA